MHATRFLRSGYRTVVKPILFRHDPEEVHERMVRVGVFLGRHPTARALTSAMFAYRHPALEQEILGIRFRNPVGLAAGFDKNAQLVNILPSVGFGFEEIGSVTGEPCPGNPKPRVWRLPQSKALLVYYGLMNDGCIAAAKRLQGKKFIFPIGTSIAKTNSPHTLSLEAGIADYVKAARTLADIGDYLTVNISCPNAYGGEPFTDPMRFDALMAALDEVQTQKPVFIKLPAEITVEHMDALLDIAGRHRIHGWIPSNLVKDRNNPHLAPSEIQGKDHGGISGVPVREPSNEIISHIYRRAGKRYLIIGCGGIFSAEDAYEKIIRGASLVQLITGMIFEGPQLIGEINRGVTALLRRDGFSHISQAIGSKYANEPIDSPLP
ncbi:quinone-dependent dihydroorotate dehydrogenase [Candidatus Uhrbacteria bacterium]|nr:quinone-dependent dihydroorotate dehydrogenase [Candidatus Uhrbacteria bacterium]